MTSEDLAPGSVEGPRPLARALPPEVFREDHTPALFWVSTPHEYSKVYAPVVESAALGTLQMSCASIRKPISRCFGRPSPRTEMVP
jgi:hypothetical protein